MAKGKKGKKGKGTKVVVYDSDDERAYQKEDVPDPTSNEYFHDAIDDYHSNKDKILLDRGSALGPADISSDEKEGVLDIDSDDSDDDNDAEIQTYKKQLRQFKSQGFREKMGSDVEEDDDDGLPDDKAWGKSRNQYYGADVDDDIDVGSEDEATAAALEEKEALAIQQRLAQQLDEGDFGLDIFTVPEPDKVSEEKTEQKIEKDLSTLSKKEKLKLLKKESPELLELIEDYKMKMTELSERLIPIHKQIKNGTLPSASSAAQYVMTKVNLCLNYCVNISFYMMLKAKKTPIHNHPVITRLLQYRNLLKQLESADEKITPLIDEVLEKIKNGETLVPEPKVSKERSIKQIKKKRKIVETDEKNKKRLSEMLDESSSEEEEEISSVPKGPKRKKEEFLTDAEKEALQNYDMMKAGRSRRNESDGEEEEEEEEEQDEEMEAEGDEAGDEGEGWEEGEDGEKRPINYQIAKNKGLTPKKKKENRNPRVKHRRKYKKALVRRKGQVRAVRTEMERYSGEASGIRAGIIGSRKLKA